MKIIALLTDFGLTDNFVGVMKAVIACKNPSVCLIDISHSIPNHNVKEAAFLLLGSFSYFPKNTVFLCVVDPGVGSMRRAIAVKTRNYYFVGPDNGVLSLAASKDGIQKIVLLNNKKYFLRNVSSTFAGRDIFAPVAAHLTKGVAFLRLGQSLKNIKELALPQTSINKDKLNALVTYQDKFGNLVTNLKKETLRNFLKKQRFQAVLNGKKIYKMYDYYAQAKNNEPFFIQGSTSFLEISLKNRSAAAYFFKPQRTGSDSYSKSTIFISRK